MQGWAAAWQRAREDFPDLEVKEDELRSYVENHSTQPGRVHPGAGAADLGAIVSDMLLAFACSRGDGRAIALFRRRYAPVVESVRARFRARAPSSDDLWSELELRLFVRAVDAPPRIEEYAGRSELAAWLKVVAARLVLNRLAGEKPETPTDARLFDAMLVTDASPELALAAAEDRAGLKRLFERAARELEARERRLLRLAFVDGFTIDDIAGVYGVHRSSAARWVKEASEALSRNVVRLARAELRLSPEQLERWARGLEGSMGLSLARFLATNGPEPSP
jgi:RNA polymerase sigma-70 factor (ECF subfamily)